MPKGIGYTPSELQTMRDEGVLSPSEILALRKRGGSDNSTRQNPELKILRDQGSMSPSEIQSRGYKYFPDN